MTLAAEIERQTEWPKEDLEHLGVCPACGRADRHVFFADLTDRVFCVAPGAWTLWRCDGCGAAYLDPRPSPSSIGRAYQGYYTHAPRAQEQRGWLGRLRRPIGDMLFNGYLNYEFGYALEPSSFLGRIRYARRREQTRDLIRSLPPPTGRGARLLEIGPGAGLFLPIAARLGYVVEGLEPDPKAAEVCRRSGFNVKVGGVPQSALPENAFEQILLSHVFEHLHYPLEALEAIWKALTPGGRLWMSMPNLESAGLQRWQANWMALDPPRHLVLYDRIALEQLLRRCGFHLIRTICFLDKAGDRRDMYMCSRNIQRGELAFAPRERVPTNVARMIEEDDETQASDPAISESLTVVAHKPMES